MQSINKLIKYLTELKAGLSAEVNTTLSDYEVPSLWLEDYTNKQESVKVHPVDYFINRLNRILEIGNSLETNKLVERGNEIVYNLFPRHTTAFVHFNGNENEYFRCSGTFIKCISLLPYLVNLGINTVYLLPVTKIGRDGNKGDLGSPYAIMNPYQLDDNLSEPALGMNVDEQFKYFIDCCHFLGIKVISEFVFRTASIDSNIALEHPEWFYWIKEDLSELAGLPKDFTYGPPQFMPYELNIIKSKIHNSDFTDLPQPPNYYKNIFTEPPETVKIINGKITGLNPDGTKSVIPSAFADWPPDDNQPLWSDVTYLKLFENPDFNYIAYNTIRMYDNKLSEPENRVTELWEWIENIVPYYQLNFGIDGVMIDMGHALPKVLLKNIIMKAREINQNFIFWEENFALTEVSRKEGFDASLGYLPFDQHIFWKFKQLVEMLTYSGAPIPFFLTPETHNTHRAAGRAGGINYSKYAFTINSFIPGLLFIHSGFELGESKPVNTGLGFEEYELAEYSPDNLPLFSKDYLNWQNQDSFPEYIRLISEIKQKYLPDAERNNKGTIKIIPNNNEYILSFSRVFKDSIENLVIIANMNTDSYIDAIIHFDETASFFFDLPEKKKYPITDSRLSIILKPFEVLVGYLID